MKKHNFYSGPSILPPSVLLQASQAVINFNESGLSILEISHRDKLFLDIIEGAQQLVKQLYNLDDNYEVLFMQGGASAQFAIIPMNFLEAHQTAGYIDTGVWSDKAIKEAKLYGQVNIIASSKEQHYTFIPKVNEVPQDLRYLHITTNNTIYGTQFSYTPSTQAVPLIADMSSDIFSRPFKATDYDLIYAGAQKNAGTSGTTLVIIKKEFLKSISKKIPMIFDYRKHAENDSLYNTPGVFAVYVSYLTLQWIINEGGLPEMAKRNEAKANLFYNELDRNSLFKGTVQKQHRSLMNANFILHNQELEKAFLKMCDEAGIVGIKGHRSVGGFRASMYNALPLESVQVLVDVMQDFENKFG